MSANIAELTPTLDQPVEGIYPISPIPNDGGIPPEPEADPFRNFGARFHIAGAKAVNFFQHPLSTIRDQLPSLPSIDIRNSKVATYATTIGVAITGGAFLASSTEAATTPKKEKARSSQVVPNALNLINNILETIPQKAQPLAEGQAVEVMKSTKIMKDLQDGCAPEKIKGVTLRKKKGSKKMDVSITQEDVMSQTAMGLVYHMADWGDKVYDRPLNGLISPDLVNKNVVTVQAVQKAANGKWKKLGGTSMMPSFDIFTALDLPAPILRGGKVGAFQARDSEDVLVASHISKNSIRASSSSISNRGGLYLKTTQTCTPRDQAYGNDKVVYTATFGPFKRAMQTKKLPVIDTFRLTHL